MQSDLIELDEYERYIQLYSTKELPKDIAILDFPRDSEEERTRLRSIGVFYLRDAVGPNPIFGENNKNPVKGFYTQLFLNENGTVASYQRFNEPVLVEWVDGARVKRKFL